MSNSTKKDIKKVKSAVLLALLLLPGLLLAFPALSIVSASTGPAPTAVTGATATIDYPIYASISNGAPSSDTRIITVTNPPGNPSITTITISVPAGAVSGTPSGTIPTYAGVPDCGGLNPACTASVFGAGPYSLQYIDTKVAGAAILPPGASILLTLTIPPEATTVSSSAVDSYPFSVSVTDTTGANTVLNSITTYYTKMTQVTLTTQSATSAAAGTLVTFGVSANQSGLLLNAGIHTQSGYVIAAGTPSVSPVSYTSSSTSTQTITVNDTTAETDTFSVGGPATPLATAHSVTESGKLNNATSAAITYNAGTTSELTINILGHTSSHQINMTSTSLLAGSNIVVYSADKYGNPVTQSVALAVTLAADTLKGQAAGFTADTVYTGSYPFTPTDLAATQALSIGIGADSASATGYYYFGPDYGSTSMLTASATGVATASSGHVVTWALNSGVAPTLSVTGGNSIAAGKAGQLEAQLPVAQSGVTVYFTISTNSTDYTGLFTNGLRAISAVSTANSTMAVAIASLNVATKVGATATVVANYLATPSANDTGGNSAGQTLTTTTGPLGALSVKAYFDAGQVNKATAVKASGTVYIDVSASDAYGNSITIVSGTVQISLSATAGTLSSTTAFITAGHNDITGSNYQVQFVAPASGSAAIAASGTYSGVTASGSLTLPVVSANPTIAFTSVPTTVTTGVAQQVTGWANASIGVSGTTVISTLQYSLNGATNVTLAAGANTNQFTVSTLLAAQNNLVVYAKDSNGVWSSLTVEIPPLPIALTFTSTGTGLPAQYQFPNGGPQSVATIFTNNGPTSITIIVVANIFTSPGGLPVTPSPTATATVAAGASVTVYNLLNGLPHGTYTVTVNVYSATYVSLSPTYTVTVTV